MTKQETLKYVLANVPDDMLKYSSWIYGELDRRRVRLTLEEKVNA